MPAETTSDATSIQIAEQGTGRPILVIHGGGGPFTVAPISEHLAAGAHTLTPTLPGWNGAPRPASLAGVGDYAEALMARLRADDLRDVVAIGSSLGGWLAAELAARDDDWRLAGVVLIDAAGIDAPGEPAIDFFSLTPREAAEHSWHDPDRFFVDPASLPEQQRETMAANMATMRTIAPSMADPSLRSRLAGVRIPALVLWGDSDRVFTPGFGRAYADAFADSRLEIISAAGHLPQLEQPAATLALIDGFLAGL
jgi:pimeloyl-ACP methyl ester carboxylesterase